ncbi:MAG TPA: 2-dehydropantoate 2-reductase, partial [Candidatus Baltobacteraceae bacterium]
MEQGKVRVGIIGSGAMGTLFGYHLASQCEVTMLDSNRAILDEIQRSGGLSVNEGAPRAVRVGRASRELYGSNVVFLFVKAVDTLRALRPFAGELSPSTPIVSLQNGVGNEDAIKTALGGAVPVVLGITTESSNTVAPGRVRSSQEGATIIGS